MPFFCSKSSVDRTAVEILGCILALYRCGGCENGGRILYVLHFFIIQSYMVHPPLTLVGYVPIFERASLTFNFQVTTQDVLRLGLNSKLIVEQGQGTARNLQDSRSTLELLSEYYPAFISRHSPLRYLKTMAESREDVETTEAARLLDPDSTGAEGDEAVEESSVINNSNSDSSSSGGTGSTAGVASGAAAGGGGTGGRVLGGSGRSGARGKAPVAGSGGKDSGGFCFIGVGSK